MSPYIHYLLIHEEETTIFLKKCIILLFVLYEAHSARVFSSLKRPVACNSANQALC